MAEVATLVRPQRWDTPFGPDMTEREVEKLLARPEFGEIDRSRFPKNTPLEGILLNDTRLVRTQPGDIVLRLGDYGNSAFLILDGDLRVVLAPGLPSRLLGRQQTRKKGFFEALAQLWTNRWLPEVRDVGRYSDRGLRGADKLEDTRVFLQDIPVVLDKHKTAKISSGTLFGELAALGRVPRTASVFSEGNAVLLEIRWQGLRELRKYAPAWRERIDESYRENALNAHLRSTALFANVDFAVLQDIAQEILFETYGSFDWHLTFKKERKQGADQASETVICREGDYPDGVLMIRAGFARVSVRYGSGQRSLTYLGAGDVFGLDELYDGFKSGETKPLQTTLTALGYVDLLRVPAHVLEEHVFPTMKPPKVRLVDVAQHLDADDGLFEWAVDERFVNATMAMLIDMDRCVRCDDCVRACASTHGGNPRFIRHGKTFDHWMVANACMHCADPVCMIGCPTGAIHRDTETGTVVVNDDTCIGCGTCANSCPYENIRLVEINDQGGRPLVDPDHGRPIFKATKCDLCVGNPGGPACVRACPHDALRRVDFRYADPFAEASG